MILVEEIVNLVTLEGGIQGTLTLSLTLSSTLLALDRLIGLIGKMAILSLR